MEAMKRASEDTAVEKQVVRTVHIAPSFEILGKCRDPDGKSQGLLLRWRDDGRMSDIVHPLQRPIWRRSGALRGPR